MNINNTTANINKSTTSVYSNTNDTQTSSSIVEETKDNMTDKSSTISKTNPNIPIITDSNYHTIPSLIQLSYKTDEELKNIENFQVIHVIYGAITWEGITDVRNIDICEAVKFGQSTVELYPNVTPDVPDELMKLNKRAKVELYNVWPKDKTTQERIKPTNVNKIKKWINKLKSRKFTQYITFNEQDGTWQFYILAA